MAKRKSNDRINNILNDVGDMDFLTEEGSRKLAASGLQVEYIHVRLIRPDPAQPRRIFPEAIYQSFHEERLTPAQAVRELIDYVKVIARQKGRPFKTVLELIPNPDAEHEIEPPNYTPEEKLVRELLNLAVTLRDDGQVNPLTVIDRSEGVSRLYQIETGERRYWAAHIVQDFLPGYEGNGSVPCIIVPQETASFLRQARENTARSGLNAIAMARQAALLILSAHGIYPPDGPVGNDFYQQASDYTLHGKAEYTSEILNAMGGIKRARLTHYKNLLRLSDEAIELADRHSIDEFKLRYVLKLPAEHHLEVVRQIIDFNLSAKQVKALCEAGEDNSTMEPTKPPTYVFKIADLILNPTETNVATLASVLNEKEEDHDVVVVRLKRFLEQLIDRFE